MNIRATDDYKRLSLFINDALYHCDYVSDFIFFAASLMVNGLFEKQVLWYHISHEKTIESSVKRTGSIRPDDTTTPTGQCRLVINTPLGIC